LRALILGLLPVMIGLADEREQAVSRHQNVANYWRLFPQWLRAARDGYLAP